MASEQYTRPVAPAEWWSLVHPESAPTSVQVVVSGTGRLDRAEVARAVRIGSPPGARLTRRGGLWVDTGESPKVHNGSLVGTCDVRMTASTLMFRASRGVMDEQGVLLWAEDVFRVLRGELPIGACCTISAADFSATGKPPGLRLEWPSILGSRSSGGPSYYRRTIPGGYSVARLASMVTAAAGLPSARFSVPVDLRRHIPGVRSTAPLDQPVVLDVRADMSSTVVDELLQDILADRRELDSGVHPAILDIPLPVLSEQIQVLHAVTTGRGRYPAVASVRHVGRVSLESFSTAAFQAGTVYAIPSPAPAAPPEFTVVESGDHTEIAVGWPASAETAARAEGLLDALANEPVKST